MIIDVHCHMWEEKILSDEMKEGFKNLANQFKYDASLITNINPEKLIQQMDEAGIDKTVLLALDYGLNIKAKLYKFYNNYIAGIIKKHPDRLIGFAGIDPRRGKEAITEIERCVDMGLKGVKLWPLTGFYPDDPEFYPFYERVQELNLPILCHTGSCPPGTYMKYNKPMYVDTVAVDFPKIKIIMAHIGTPWEIEALFVAAKNKNVYVDISSWQMPFIRAPFVFFQTLIQAKRICRVEKILFGSDWPLFIPHLSQKKWVQTIKKLEIPQPMKLMGASDFTDEEKNMILGGNAQKVLNL